MKRFLPFLIAFLLLGGCLWAQEQENPYHDALRQLVERADSGDAKSMFELAKLHDRGFDTITVDSARSTSLYLTSAQAGYPPAMNFLGFRYYNGEGGLEKNIDSALFWIRKAADAGDITAAANLGYLLTEGKDITHDEDEAVKWLGIAAEAGMMQPQFKFYELMEENWKNLDTDSVMHLGLDYYIGHAPILGVKLIELAAEENNAKALTLLGDAYSKGLGVAYDHQKSIDYFFKGAIQGDPSAQYIVGELLEFFPDTSSTFAEVETPSYWFEQAAAQGVTDSEKAYQHLFSYP